jgi:transposase-like protein
MTKRKSFSAGFKREAVRMMESSGKLPSELARELGIPRNRLYKWKEQLAKGSEGAFPGSGRGSGSQDEVSRRSRLLPANYGKVRDRSNRVEMRVPGY